MKFTPSFSATALGLALLVSVSAQSSDPIKFELPQIGSSPATAPATTAPAAGQPAATPAAPAIKYTEAQMMEVYGFMLGDRLNLRPLEFSQAQVESIARGLIMAVNGQQPNYDAQQIMPQLQQLIQTKQQAFLVKVRNHNLSETAKFFTALKENTAVKELEGSNGLRYEVLKAGTGAVPKAGQIVTMHFTGGFINGQVFESTLRAPEGKTPEPVDVLIQQGALIDGMATALLKMPVGSKWRIYIPPHLAYGDDGMAQIGIPPAATLIFEIETFGVKDAPKEATEAKK